MKYLKELEGVSAQKLTVVKGIDERSPLVVLYVKFNFDATFNQSLNISSLGIVVRNHRGSTVRYSTGFFVDNFEGDVKHVYKSANYLDHFLASGNLKLGQETYLLGGVPDSVADAVKRRHLREPD
ncbi:hypothetical protein GOBAR_AA23602 [Gossypium barbadense]|uniref:Uncharacterized protein n=1 Tax=Gossypium barbadense TaxID=3634 RepID=A0A2P5X150_GOSBA|nr:hypothetical protein GOBAR_AA23602 [Gossypium barbadense]